MFFLICVIKIRKNIFEVKIIEFVYMDVMKSK